MNLRERIRNYLGITGIRYEFSELENRLDALDATLKGMKAVNIATSVAIGRVLARDPVNTTSEFDPVRKAESDRLGAEAIDRLIAEDAARRHTFGE